MREKVAFYRDTLQTSVGKLNVQGMVPRACVRAGDDEIDVPREGMDSATFHTDKVELAKMAGTL